MNIVLDVTIKYGMNVHHNSTNPLDDLVGSLDMDIQRAHDPFWFSDDTSLKMKEAHIKVTGISPIFFHMHGCYKTKEGSNFIHQWPNFQFQET